MDALRGVAALVVLLQHAAELLWEPYARWSVEVVRPGEWGVFVFFCVSGFVIPMSVRRHGDVVGFWIGRFFRLFPLYWIALALAVLAWQFGSLPVPASVTGRPLLHVALNVTMVQNFLGGSNIVAQSWSLAYEMVFYLFITVLVAARSVRGSVRAVVLALAGSTTVGLLIGPKFIQTGDRNKAIFLVLGFCAAAVTLLWPKIPAGIGRIAAVAASIASVVLVLNQPIDLWFSFLLFATIFAGWVYHEAHTGAVASWVPFATSAAVVIVGAAQLHTWVLPHPGAWGSMVTWRPDALTFLLAHATFAVGYLLRSRSVPSPVLWLGKISYSVYLLHGLVIHQIAPLDSPIATMVMWVGVTLVLSAAAYRFVEIPGQDLGRRVRTRWIARGSVRVGTATGC